MYINCIIKYVYISFKSSLNFTKILKIISYPNYFKFQETIILYPPPKKSKRKNKSNEINSSISRTC